MSTRMHIVVPDGLVARIDGALGPGQSRADFVRRAVERSLAPIPHMDADDVVDAYEASEQALGSSGRAGVRGRVPASAPAEQPGDERALSEAKEPIRREQADPGSVSSSEGVRSAAPAHPRVRSSSVARPFRPAPKQGKK